MDMDFHDEIDFSDDLKETDKGIRDVAIEVRINGADWFFPLCDCCNGGYPEDIYVYSVSVSEYDNCIKVGFEVGFIESTPTGCKDYNRRQPMSAHIRLEINKLTGMGKVVEAVNNVDEDLFVGDYQ